MQASDDVRARVEIAALTEPGHTVTGHLLRIIGPADTLALLRNPRIPLPAQIDPLLGTQWREATAARLIPGLADRVARLTDQHELRVLTPGGPGWPASFADLGDRAPVMLWAKGNPELLTSSLTSRVTFTGGARLHLIRRARHRGARLGSRPGTADHRRGRRVRDRCRRAPRRSRCPPRIHDRRLRGRPGSPVPGRARGTVPGHP